MVKAKYTVHDKTNNPPPAISHSLPRPSLDNLLDPRIRELTIFPYIISSSSQVSHLARKISSSLPYSKGLFMDNPVNLHRVRGSLRKAVPKYPREVGWPNFDELRQYSAVVFLHWCEYTHPEFRGVCCAGGRFRRILISCPCNVLFRSSKILKPTFTDLRCNPGVGGAGAWNGMECTKSGQSPDKVRWQDRRYYHIWPSQTQKYTTPGAVVQVITPASLPLLSNYLYA